MASSLSVQSSLAGGTGDGAGAAPRGPPRPKAACWWPESLPYVEKPRCSNAAASPAVRLGMLPFIPPPPIWAAWPVHEAGSTTRKLIGRPYELLSMGAMAPSIEQYAGVLPAATQRG